MTAIDRPTAHKQPAPPPIAPSLRHAPPRPSPASTLPTELLLRVFELMPMMYAGEVREDLVAWTVTSSCPDLPLVARVCRTWRAAAQSTLFHSISLVRRSQVLGFIEAARLRPDLAAKVVAMQVGLVRGTPEYSEPFEQQVELSDHCIEALSLVPKVRHVLVSQLKKGTRWRFVDVLEGRPLQTLAFKMYDSKLVERDTSVLTGPGDVYRAFSIPTLRTFELNFRPKWARVANYAGPVATPQLDSLSITVNAPAGLFRLMTAAAPTLVRLHVYTENALDPASATAAFRELVHVREFRFESNIPEATPADNRWLQTLVPSFTRLERLSLCEQTADWTVLHGLPPALRLVEYLYWDARPDHSLQQLEAALRTMEELSLPQLVLTVDDSAFEETVEDGDVDRIREALKAKGVDFEVGFEPLQIPAIRWVDF
ncbi:hypothetical protein JCM10450v2_008027 [Rhodotorula kratochvilovae]